MCAARRPPCDRRRSSRWGPWAVKPRSRSAARRSRQLGRRAPRRRRPPSAGGSPASACLGQPELAPRVPRTAAPAGRPPRARAAISCDAVARRARASHDVERVRRRPRRPGCGPSSALRCASAREYAVRASARAGQTAATSCRGGPARLAGAPFTSSSRSGRNTLDAAAAPALPTGCPQAAPSTRSDLRRRPARSPPRAGGRRRRRRSVATVTRATACPAAHQLAVVGGPRRAARAAEVQRLQEVRLAGAVGAGDHRQAGPELDLRAPRSCGSPAASTAVTRTGRRAAQTFSRIGMTR